MGDPVPSSPRTPDSSPRLVDPAPPQAAIGGAQTAHPERRGIDRRSRPTPRFSRYSLWGGRRRGPRRDSEVEGSFVDLYPLRLWAVLGWVALMNVLDSYFTLLHLQDGGIELNPVADALLRTGRLGFVFSKSALITVALAVLCVHKNFRLARMGLGLAAGMYTLLVIYHLLLLRV